MFLVFMGLVITALVENKPAHLGFWTIITAGEIAAWRIKWEVLFSSLIGLSISGQIMRTISQNPQRFIGLLPAQIGLGGVITVTLMVAGLIGITVPERLRQRQYSIEAASSARGHTIDRALLQYRDLHGTYPTDPDNWIEALKKLPDEDGSIHEALRFADPSGYAATATVAVAATKSKPVVGRGTALRGGNPAATLEPAAVPFTSYTLRLPSEHRWFGPDENYIMQDGVIKKESEVSPAAANSLRKP
jgi:type II secretory pathway pseudopilin PulG